MSNIAPSQSTGVPLLDLKAQYLSIRDEVVAAIDRVVECQNFILGPEVEALEHEIAQYSQCQFGIGVSSGTDALLVSLMALDLLPGDEVITTPYTFFATAGAIHRLGGKPVFVDIEPGTYNMDPTLIEAAVTPRTRAIIPVHLYGQVADMDPILEVARRRKLFVIEDAAQAIGAEYKNQRAGSIGDLGCFSFFPSKNLGGFGDGGMVVTSDSGLAERIRILRNHGYSPKYYNKYVGGNFRLDALQAAILRCKMKHLDDWTAFRQKNASSYRNLLAEASLTLTGNGASPTSPKPPVILPAESEHGRHIYNQFVIRVQHRDELRNFLKEERISTEIYYPVPLHLQECFTNLGYSSGSLPQSEQAAAETVALPIYPELAQELLGKVVKAISRFYLLMK